MLLSQTNGVLLKLYKTVGETVEHLSKAGFKCFDISFFSSFVKGSIYFSPDYMQIVDEYRNAIEKYNVRPVQAHEPAGNSIGDDGGEYYMKKTPRSIEMASKIGCPSITIHPGSANTYPMSKEEFVSSNIAAIKKLIPYAEKYNIELLLENIGIKGIHNNMCYHSISAQDLLDIVEEINHPLININWDVGHAFFNGLNEYEEILKLGKRLHGLHVHDNMGFKSFESEGKSYNCDMHTLPLFYNIDFDRIIDALKVIDYKGTFNFEVDSPKSLQIYVIDNPELLPYAQKARLESDKTLYALGELMLRKNNCFEG